MSICFAPDYAALLLRAPLPAFKLKLDALEPNDGQSQLTGSVQSEDIP